MAKDLIKESCKHLNELNALLFWTTEFKEKKNLLSFSNVAILCVKTIAKLQY